MLMGQSGGTNFRIMANQGATERRVRINTFTNLDTDDNATTGLVVGIRRGSANQSSSRNGGTEAAAAATSNARTAEALGYLLSFSTFSDAQVALGFAGSQLSSSEVTDLYNAALAYLQAVGAA
jgi:hypothetical protein